MLQSARVDRKVHLAKVFRLLQRRKCGAKSVDGTLKSSPKGPLSPPLRPIAVASSRPPATASGKLATQQVLTSVRRGSRYRDGKFPRRAYGHLSPDRIARGYDLPVAQLDARPDPCARALPGDRGVRRGRPRRRRRWS